MTVGQRRPKPPLLQQENIGTFFTPAGENPLPLPSSCALGWDGKFGMELKFLPLPVSLVETAAWEARIHELLSHFIRLSNRTFSSNV